jgi:hypothetical protein
LIDLILAGAAVLLTAALRVSRRRRVVRRRGTKHLNGNREKPRSGSPENRQ